MKILVCSTEYPPNGSGIGNVVSFVSKIFVKKDHICDICSSYGTDITVGNKKLLPKTFWFTSVKLIYYWYCVSKYFSNNSFEYDVVWLHQPLFLLKKCPFKKGVITIHTTYNGKQIRKMNYSLLQAIYLKLMKHIEKFCFRRIPSSFRYTYIDNKIFLESVDIGIQNVGTVISNGVDTRKFSIKNKILSRIEFDVDLNSLTFISVGRLVDLKRPILMLDIFKRIQRVKTNSTLIIVGDGPQFADMEKYVIEQNIQNIKFMGFVDHDNLPSLYSCADYYIMTSEYEGQPLTLLEAMASGLPCIVSDIPNLRIVEDAECGIVVDFSDKEKAEKRILEYIEGDHSSHAKNARIFAQEKLDWEIIAEQYLMEFKKIK